MKCYWKRKKLLELLIESKGNWLMFRQWFHPVSGLIASFFAGYLLLSGGSPVEMVNSSTVNWIICLLIYANLSLNWIFDTEDRIEKFRKQLEGYHKLCQ